MIKHSFVDSVIQTEKMVDKKRSQSVAVILLSPDGQQLCLTVTTSAVLNGRRNVSTPQGRIGSDRKPLLRYESLVSAATRKIYESLRVKAHPTYKTIYLGSVVREFSKSNPTHPTFKSRHYHWVCMYAPSWTLEPQDSVVEARWWTFSAAVSCSQSCMSEDDQEMFILALSEMKRLAGDTTIIRPKALFRQERTLVV